MRSMIQALYSENQGNSRAWLGCSFWSWYGLGDDASLSNVIHASYNTNEIDTYGMVQ